MCPPEHPRAHRASEIHAAAIPVFTELIAASDFIIGEMLMAKGLGGGQAAGNMTCMFPVLVDRQRGQQNRASPRSTRQTRRLALLRLA